MAALTPEQERTLGLLDFSPRCTLRVVAYGVASQRCQSEARWTGTCARCRKGGVWCDEHKGDVVEMGQVFCGHCGASGPVPEVFEIEPIRVRS